MATIAENLQTITDSTSAIKQAIIDKGGTIEGDITTWADAISGLSGGGSSEEEITFTGTIVWDMMTCTITGDLSSRPEGMTSMGSLVMVFRSDSGVATNNKSIVMSIKNISITCNYGQPETGYEIPALFIAYASKYETKTVPVKFIQQTPIKFYVNGEEYNALSPMTWEQFVNSETYNPTLTDVNGTSYKAFLIKNGNVYYERLYDGELDMQLYVYIAGNIEELSTNIIKENTQYLAD